MKLSEVIEILKAEVVTGNENLDSIIKVCAASDLMSDILRGPKEHVLLLSGLNNIQLIRTCVISGSFALVLVRDKKPDKDMVSLALAHDISLLCTPFTLFTACGRLFQAGLRGVDPKKVV